MVFLLPWVWSNKWYICFKVVFLEVYEWPQDDIYRYTDIKVINLLLVFQFRQWEYNITFHINLKHGMIQLVKPMVICLQHIHFMLGESYWKNCVLAPKKIVVLLAYAPPMRIGIKHKLMMLLAIGHSPTSVYNKITCFKWFFFS
jgi:hypothetical protein